MCHCKSRWCISSLFVPWGRLGLLLLSSILEDNIRAICVKFYEEISISCCARPRMLRSTSLIFFNIFHTPSFISGYHPERPSESPTSPASNPRFSPCTSATTASRASSVSSTFTTSARSTGSGHSGCTTTRCSIGISPRRCPSFGGGPRRGMTGGRIPRVLRLCLLPRLRVLLLLGRPMTMRRAMVVTAAGLK